MPGVMHPDIYIEEDMLPGSQYDFGRTLVGIGDFTGDGIPDIATNGHQSILYGGHGTVQIFAGYNPNPTDVVVESEPTLPDDYILHQNYPNPFNPSTTIEFELPVGQHVTLDVFNVLGQKVRTVTDQHFVAGNYEIEWDGRDENGEPVSTGVYFYRLTTGEESFTRKMMLLK